MSKCVQLIFQYHVRLNHAHHITSGSHLLPPYLQPEGVVLQKAIFKDLALKEFFSSIEFNDNLSKVVDIKPQALILTLYNSTQSGLIQRSSLPSSKVCGKLVTKTSP